MAKSRTLLQLQQEEIDGNIIYGRLASLEKAEENKKILNRLSREEKKHYLFLKNITKKELKANKFRFSFFSFLAVILGNTFILRMLERSEGDAQRNYEPYRHIEGIEQIIDEEKNHEDALIDMLKEERLNYMGSIVLGLNDALVELTGALAGYTLALQDPRLIALTGSITGIAAALSMGSSEYLSRKSDGEPTRIAIRSAFYTGIAYIITVIALILPFILLRNVYLSLAITLFVALSVIAVFNFYFSVVKKQSFRKRFGEMAIISFSVALISFFIGFLLNKFIPV